MYWSLFILSSGQESREQDVLGGGHPSNREWYGGIPRPGHGHQEGEARP